MSHRIYTKKRDAPEATENAIKFWSINAFFCLLDIVETMVFNAFPDIDFTFYFLYIIFKSIIFAFLSYNNFQFSGTIYNMTIPKVMPLLEGKIDILIERAQGGFSLLFTKYTPALLSVLGSQLWGLVIYAGIWFMSSIEFKSASNEPPPSQRNAVSFIQDEKKPTSNALDKTTLNIHQPVSPEPKNKARIPNQNVIMP